MANDSDGSITIDTELDNTGFEKGANKLLDAVKGVTAQVKASGEAVQQAVTSSLPAFQNLTNAVDNLGDNMMGSFSQIIPLLQSIASATGMAGAKMEDTATQAANAGNQIVGSEQAIKAATQNTTAIIDQQKQSTENAAAAQQNLASGKGVKNFDKELAKIQTKIDSTKAKLAEYYKAIEDVKAATDETLARTTTDDQAGNVLDIEKMQLQEINNKYAAQIKLLKDLETEYARIAALKANAAMDNSGAAGADKAAITDVSKQTDTSSWAKQGAGAWTAFGRIIKGVGSTAARVGATIAKLGRSAFAALAYGVKKAISGFKIFNKQANKTSLTTNGLVKSLRGMKNMLIMRFKSLFITSIVEGVRSGIQSLAQFSSAFDTAMSNIKNSMGQLSGNLSVAFGGLLSVIEPVLTKIINIISTAITYVNALFALLSGKSTMLVAKKQMGSYADETKGAAGAAEELNNQVYGFDELNKRNADNAGKSGGGGDTGGIEYEEKPISSLLPDDVLSFFERIREAIEKCDWPGLGSLLAEKLNELIARIDKWINEQLRPKGVEWAARIAEILNGLVDETLWGEIGKMLADGMNAIFDIINTFLSKFNFENLGEGIGEMISSFFEYGEWDLVGETFANAWNALIDTVYGIVSNTEMWVNIGNAIAEFVNSFAENFKLEKAVLAIGEWINGVVTALQIAIENIQWAQISARIGTAVNLLFTSIDWVAVGELVASGLNTVIQSLIIIITTIDWVKIGSDLGNGISSIFTNIDWVAVGEFFADSFNAIIQSLYGFISTIDWVKVGEDLGNGISSLFTSIDWVAVGELFASGLNTIIQALYGFISTIDWSKVGEDLGTSIRKMIENIDWTSVGETLKGAAEDLFDLITGFLTGLFGGEEGESATGDIIASVAASLGALYAAFKALEIVYAVTKAIIAFNAILAANPIGIVVAAVAALVAGLVVFYNTNEDFREACDKAWEGIKAAWDKAKEAFSALWESLKPVMESIKKAFKAAWEYIKVVWDIVGPYFSDLWDEIKSIFSAVKTFFEKTFKSSWEAVKIVWDVATDFFQQLWDTVASIFSVAKDILSGDFEGAWEEIKSCLSGWGEFFQETWDNICLIFEKAGEWFKDVGSDIVNGIKKGIKEKWDDFTTWAKDIFNGLTKTAEDVYDVHSPSKVFAQMGGYLVEGLQNGIADSESDVLRTVSNLAQSVNDEMVAGGAISVGVAQGDMLTGLDAAATRLSSIAGTFQTIANVLLSLGGIQIPQIAAGTVIPAKTRISSGAAASGTTDEYNTLSADMDERLADQTYILKQILAHMQKLKLTVDGDSLSQAISSAQRHTTRNYGGA